jgi:uncharacterized membrane protein
MEDNIVAFLGRFHPLVVHLPIGILLLAGLMQVISLKGKKYTRALDPAISFTLFWGGISSLGAIFIGWLLSLQGGYDDDTLFWHKWLGILLTLLSFLAWLIKTNKIRLQKSIFYLVLGLVITLVGVTGHLGGNLTHGDAYLVQYAPNFIKKIAGVEMNKDQDLFANVHPDSLAVFPYLIQPILDKKCTGCHNSKKLEGGLLLTNYKEIIKGGDNGTIINTDSPFKSEWLNRITLPKQHKKFMPPKGAPMTYGEIQIIEWWMRNGADSISKFSSSMELDEELMNTLLRDYNLDYNPKAHYEKVKVDSLSASVITDLINNQFTIDFMGETNNMISVSYQGDSIRKSQMEKLLLAKNQITWLNLSNCNLTDDMLGVITDFTNLTRLNIHSNPITDRSVPSLENFEHLISINLYNTRISNKSLEQLASLPSLTKLFIWKTGITNEEIIKISDKYPHIEIVAKLN